DVEPRELTQPPVRTPAGTPDFPGYRIVKEVGRGSMGVVYKAVQTASGRVVAIKTLLPQVAASAAHVRTFEREIEIMRQLRHPNIVEMLEYGQSNLAARGLFYFVLELVEGPDLDGFVAGAGGVLPLSGAAPLMRAALAGLAHAHSASIRTRLADGTVKYFKGVVHRDIKAQNILLARNARGFVAKVADFGLSKSFESAGMTDMTMPGQLAGTPTYWPREQITHYKYLYPATDVFSIAAVFYRALTGAWVRDGFDELFKECERRGRPAGISDFLRVISSHAARPIRDRNPDVPPPVAAVIDRALREAEVAVDESQMRAKLAELRYADAGAFRVALIAALKEAGIKA
ncbi:MAG: serine/threonine-protein kinase, partial [Planctomycetota bacterium]|nr:serine/threonine-protein kinase [Planctomycetota bacterium]